MEKIAFHTAPCVTLHFLVNSNKDMTFKFDEYLVPQMELVKSV